MIQRNYKIIAASAVLAVSALAGCNKVVEVDIPDLYRKAYVTTDIYPYNEGHYEVATVNKAPSFVLSDGKLVHNQGGEVLVPAGIQSYKVYFRTNYAVDSELKGALALMEDAEAYVEKYNAAHGLSGEDACELLPAEYYTVNGSSAIKAGAKEGEPFVVEFSDSFKDIEYGDYLIPLVCTLQGDSVEMSEKQNTVIFRLSRKYVDESAGAPKERILYNGVDFTFEGADAASFYDAPYDAGALFNDDVTDVCYCNGQYSDLNIYFNEPVALSRMGFVLNQAYYNSLYYWMSWVYEDDSEGDVGGYYLSVAKTSEPEVVWFDLAGSYMDGVSKVSSLYFMLYYAYYNFSEIYFVAFDE